MINNMSTFFITFLAMLSCIGFTSASFLVEKRSVFKLECNVGHQSAAYCHSIYGTSCNFHGMLYNEAPMLDAYGDCTNITCFCKHFPGLTLNSGEDHDDHPAPTTLATVSTFASLTPNVELPTTIAVDATSSAEYTIEGRDADAVPAILEPRVYKWKLQCDRGRPAVWCFGVHGTYCNSNGRIVKTPRFGVDCSNIRCHCKREADYGWCLLGEFGGITTNCRQATTGSEVSAISGADDATTTITLTTTTYVYAATLAPPVV